MSTAECHEEVSRRGELQPCEKPAVGQRADPVNGGLYPVCRKHYRAPFTECGWVEGSDACSGHPGGRFDASDIPWCSAAFDEKPPSGGAS